MDIPDEVMILRVMRRQAWERAKAELIAMALTHSQLSPQFAELTGTIEQLVEFVESNNLQE